MSEYQKKKNEVREMAMMWQIDCGRHSYTYGDLVNYYDRFEKLGKRYGLIKEFRANCII